MPKGIKMNKISINLGDYSANKLYPSALFLYGTYKEDGSPNFGLFCWLNYCYDTELAIMACIGGSKLTKDRIKTNKVFSANLVTEPLLPLADYLGSTPGYSHEKMDIPIDVEQGAVLNVPVLKKSPWIYELETTESILLKDSEIFICKIHNILAAKDLADKSINEAEHIKAYAPVLWFGSGKYYSTNPVMLGKTGDWKNLRGLQ